MVVVVVVVAPTSSLLAGRRGAHFRSLHDAQPHTHTTYTPHACVLALGPKPQCREGVNITHTNLMLAHARTMLARR